MSASVADVLAAFDLEKVGEFRYQANNAPAEGPVLFGGQLIGQAVVAAALTEPAKRVKSVHTVFARTGMADAPVTITVEPLHSGRSMASLTALVSQGERRLSQSLVMLDVEDEDVIRRGSPVPTTAGPDAAVPQQSSLDGWEQRFAEAVDLFDPAAVGPPELQIWSRFGTDRKEPAIAMALLAWASVGSFIGTAMRPHEGVGLSLAHRTLSTGVLSQTLTVHDAFEAQDWLLLALRSTFAGGGRAFGTGEVFTPDGRLVASCAQESLIRRMARPGSTL